MSVVRTLLASVDNLIFVELSSEERMDCKTIKVRNAELPVVIMRFIVCIDVVSAFERETETTSHRSFLSISHETVPCPCVEMKGLVDSCGEVGRVVESGIDVNRVVRRVLAVLVRWTGVEGKDDVVDTMSVRELVT